MDDATELIDIEPRDIALLQARIANPTASSRKLSDILEGEYGISLSHNRINSLLREMEQKDLFRRTVIPRRSIFQHYLFRIGFHYPNFKDHWKECRETLIDDPHVLMFFNADSEYRWQLITQFQTTKKMDRWVTDFLEKHGEMIDSFDMTSIHNLHKFQTDAAIFDEILSGTEEGREYLEEREFLDDDMDTGEKSEDD